jgi:hypothetical protein
MLLDRLCGRLVEATGRKESLAQGRLIGEQPNHGKDFEQEVGRGIRKADVCLGDFISSTRDTGGSKEVLTKRRLSIQ